MATLTYNPNDPEAPEFSEQEQQDIQLGEQIQDAEQSLLAGKYKSAEDLEQAYIELQGKLGVDDEPDEEQSEPEDTEQEEETQDEETDDDDDVIELTEEDVTNLQNIVGGVQEYNSMLEWAADNVPEHEVEMFNHVMDLEDPSACFFAVHALNQIYKNSVGYEGKMLTGKAAQDTKSEFRSQAELVAAMEDPRYDKDPAYRLDVETKLENSNLQF